MQALKDGESYELCLTTMFSGPAVRPARDVYQVSAPHVQAGLVGTPAPVRPVALQPAFSRLPGRRPVQRVDAAPP